MLRSLVAGLRALLHPSQRNTQIEDELKSFFESSVEDKIRSGMSPEKAERAARIEIGSREMVRHKTWSANWESGIDSIVHDLHFAARQLRKAPGFATTVIGTLALGIGAAAAMFTVVEHVLLRPVSYTGASQLVSINEVDKFGISVTVPWLDIEQWRKQSRSFEGIAFWTGAVGRNFLDQGKTAVEVNRYAVSADLLTLLGAQPMLGRGFLPATPSFGPDENSGTVVLSYAAWQELGGRPDVLGKTVRINDVPWTVVGVMPPGFRYPAATHAGGALWSGDGMTQVWTPVELSKADAARNIDTPRYEAVGRLKPGVTLKAAQAEGTAIQKPPAREWAGTKLDHSNVKIEQYSKTLVDADVRKALLALLAASGVLWLIASLNVTNLLLARGTARQREMAMRLALGASRQRIVRQMMVEGLALSIAAGVLGIGLAAASVKLLAHEIQLHLPLPVPARPDGWILLALVGLTVASAVLSTAWPALVTARAPLEPALKQGGLQTGQSRRHHRMRGALVALEIAMSLALLMGCGLLLRTIYALRQVPLGFRTDHVVVADLDIPAYRYAHRNLTTDLYEPLLERIRNLEGVENAGLMTEVPLGENLTLHIAMAVNGRRVAALFKASSPGVEKVFGFRMAAGRFFDSDDTATSQQVALVNEAFAQAYSPDKHNPAAIVGTKLMGSDRGTSQADYTVVAGVLQDEHQASISEASRPELDLCIPQLTPKSLFYDSMDEIGMDLAVRTQQPAEVVIPEIRDLLRRADPELATAKIRSMDQVVEDSYGSQQLAAHLLEIFGGSALLLCVAGLYGLLTYVVNQRTRELGVRIALGAPRANVLWLVMRHAGTMLVVGVAVGSGMALASGRLAKGFLYGVKADDGWTLALAALVLFMSGMLAAYLPAHRAASVDPMEALRAE
jgi:predicted permease